MQLYKLSIFILFVVFITVIPVASDFLAPPPQSIGTPNTEPVDLLPFFRDATAFQAAAETRPALWWTVVVVLLIDIGCVIGYLFQQRQRKWRRLYWRLATVDHQRLIAIAAALHETEMSARPRYELLEQTQEGGFYLVLKAKKAPDPYGPALFS